MIQHLKPFDKKPRIKPNLSLHDKELCKMHIFSTWSSLQYMLCYWN